MGTRSSFNLDPEQLNELLAVGAEGINSDVRANPDVSIKSGLSKIATQRLGTWIGQYKLVGFLGEGGMAYVYLAEQEYPIRRRVALKLIKPGMDSTHTVARFEAERQALALLDHPNIAHIYDAGITDSGQPYFAMEYIEGLAITEHCDRYQLTIEERLKLFLQICHAVHHAHQKGIIHRDIKPSNVLVSCQDDQAVPKIIDFGIAKAISQSLTERTLMTEDNQLLGTPEYMSPEQTDRASEDIDTRSDIYSLGVLLYVLLTGVLPFGSKTLREGGIENIRKTIRETDPKKPSTRLSSLGEEAKQVAQSRRMEIEALAKRLHKELEWIPLKAMRKERSERYRSAAELADDVDNYLKGAPLIAGSPVTVYKLRKFVRRNRMMVTGIAAILVILIVGIVVSTLFAIKADHMRVEAESVSDFLRHSVLELMDPYRTSGQEITRRSVLDAISENLEQEFTGPPLAEAQIRSTLGHAYWSIGAYDISASHLEHAIAVCRTHLGPVHSITLEWIEDLGWTYISQDRLLKAERLLEGTLEDTRRALGAEHEQTGRIMWVLGSGYWHQGHYEQAELLLEKALKIAKRQKNGENLHVVQIMESLVWVYISQARYYQAEQLARRALAINLRLPDQNEFFTLALKMQIGRTLGYLGFYEQAEQLQLEVLDRRRKLFGVEHANTLWLTVQMGRLYNTQGRYDQAETLLEEALKTARRVLGDTHNATRLAMFALGSVYLSQERYDRSEQLLSDALETGRRIPGEVHPYLLHTINSLAVLYTKQKHYDKAERFFDEALKSRKLKLGEDHPHTLKTINDLGMLRRKQKRYDEAESLLRQALDGRKLKLGDDHPACFESMHELAVLYKEQRLYDKAEPPLLEALEGRRLKLGDTHPYTLESWNNLIDLYQAWGKPGQANQWRAKMSKDSR